MKKYAFLNEVIIREFKTLGTFSRESGIPKATLSMLINGRYEWDETTARRRVTDAIKKLRPNIDLSHIWDPSFAWHQKCPLEKGIIKNGFRIIVDVRLNKNGEVTIAPFVEGY